MHFDLVTLY